MTDAAEQCEFADIVEALLPGNDAAFEDVGHTKFVENRVVVPVSPVEQLATGFVRRLLFEPNLGGAGVVQFARHDHRSALLTAICVHLLARSSARSLCGPVVFVSSDLNLRAQLKALTVENRRRMNLADGNPLSAHRLTGAGQIMPVIGTAGGRANQSLVYYNPRVGSPMLECDRPAVVIDGTTVRNPEARTRVVKWASDHRAAAVCFVGDLGDSGMLATLETARYVPILLALTADVLANLAYTFGIQDPTTSNLGAGGLLHIGATEATVRPIDAPLINRAISDAFYALANKPLGETPYELELPLKLLRQGMRLVSSTEAYRRACANNPRPGEGPVVSLRRLDTRQEHFPAAWRGWGTAYMGVLRQAVKGLWRELDGGNPKLRALWSVLESTAPERGRILIRCHSRAGAEALLADLSADGRTASQVDLWEQVKERTSVVTFAHRAGLHEYGTQILSGAPPPWQLSSVVGAEAGRTVVLAYAPEAVSLERQARGWAEMIDGSRRAACRSLRVEVPPATRPPVSITGAGLTITAAGVPDLPNLDLVSIITAATALIDAPEDPNPTPSATGISGSTDCVPVVLEGGRIWWVPNEGDRMTPVLVLTAGGHEYVPVGAIRAGHQVVVPAGDGVESVHARLVAASRSNSDVAALDAILGQFRAAARRVIQSAGSLNVAKDRLAAAGAEHGGQIEFWASGKTIAPREPGDVVAVFRVAETQAPDLAVLYAVASTLRELNRSLGRFVDALAGGTNSDAVERLRAVVGDTADEILDEFVVCRVAEVRSICNVPSSIAGRIR